MLSGFLHYLPWSNCRYFDVWGVLADGQQVFIKRVNAYQDVQNGQINGLHGGMSIVPIIRPDRFKMIRIRGGKGRIHYMGMGWSKNAILASGGDTGFISWDNVNSKPGQGVCRDISTPLNDIGGGNTIYLDRHTLQCADNEYLNKYQVSNAGQDGKIQLLGRCCKVPGL
jgi:hypothetical protein